MPIMRGLRHSGISQAPAACRAMSGALTADVLDSKTDENGTVFRQVRIEVAATVVVLLVRVFT